MQHACLCSEWAPTLARSLLGLYLLKLYHLNRTLGAGKDFAAACQMPDQTSTCAAQHSMCPRPSLELSPLILSNMQVYITVGASSK